jgi:exonuclease SbcC
MKPLYLEMNYFGPHEHSIIDFQKLDESPIFLIGGDTGAGKSTIFDAMTYALFNTTTGDREARDMRSQFATPNQNTCVTFYFEQSNHIYKIVRTPEQYLAKKTGKGVTKKTPTAKLAIVKTIDGVETENIATKPVDVGHAITDILKLNADQFKKIILLPQNDFSEFLKSNTADKEKILKKIFGTQLFTDFTAKLKEHFDEVKLQAANFEREIKSQLESPVWTPEEQTILSQLPSEQLLETLQKFINQRQAQVTNAETTEKNQRQRWQKADQDYHTAKELQNRFDQLDQAKTKFQKQILDHAETYAHNQEHLTELKWAKTLQTVVHDLNSKQSETDRLSKKAQQLITKLNQSQNDLKQHQANLDKLNQQIPDFEGKQQKIEQLQGLIPKIEDLENIQKQLIKLRPSSTELQQLVKKQDSDLAEIKTLIEQKRTNLAPLANLRSQKDRLVQSKDHWIDVLTPTVNQQATIDQEITRLQEQLNTSNTKLQTKKEAFVKAKLNYNEKIKTRQTLMVAQLRQELSDDTACPVCGSLDHPYAENLAPADEVQLRQSMTAVDDAQKHFAAIETEVKNLTQNIDDLKSNLATQNQYARETQNTLDRQYHELVTNIDLTLPENFDFDSIKQQFKSEINTVTQEIQKLQKIADKLETLQAQQADAEKISAKTHSKLDRITAEIDTHERNYQNKTATLGDITHTSDELTKQKNALVSEYEDFQKTLKTTEQELHACELKHNEKKTQLTSNQTQIKQIQSDINTLSEQIEQALADPLAPSNDQTQLEQWLSELEQDRLSQLQESIVNYNKEKELLEKDIEQLEQTLQNVEKPALDQLKQSADDQLEQHKNALQTLTKIQKDLEDTQISFGRVKQIMQEQGDFATELTAITSLYNVINGKDGNDNKLKLETYVVQNYLQKILSYANETFLNRLSNNRYSFIISEQAADRQRDHGLDINVYDRETNAVRSAATLSGGETFIAALSIALSLSEVVQSSANGVQIDALFVDEGFGSLDDETLGKAMNALQDIGKNRMVGVISHIDSMKQSIGQQLLIKKLGNGRSKIELINK